MEGNEAQHKLKDMSISLSWLQISHSKIRLLIALAGIGFADILMFLQLGFRAALFESAITLHKRIEGDIFLMSSQSTALIGLDRFSQRRMYQALAVEGVESMSPIYINFALWKNPIDKNTRGIMVIGIDPSDQVLNLPNFEENKEILKLEDYVLFDKKSRSEFGPIAQLYAENKVVKTEVSEQQVTVGGLFELGASFGADGNIITSESNFLRIAGGEQGLIEIGVLRVSDDANLDVVLAKVRQILPDDVQVFSKEEFMDHEKSYWQNSTAIGFIFTLGTAIGLVVGIVIVYQILYTDVSDHLPEYATLKAMGYRDRYFLSLVFQEALILAVLGFIPSAGIATVLYQLTLQATGLPIVMTVTRLGTVFVLTVVMCTFSGAIAVRRLEKADPADIF
ncbi:DevC protein [Dactylococcopsis salina PCC 8305]|uniref:DevC protein n=2 Tax=Dactylococcopsis salina TaxID=292566 RepID=K9YRH1_DACS8|nr:DevC protein [Dactylococcopsis salina PCC 8305]